MGNIITVPLYFRKKQRSHSEFEILFSRPITGLLLLLLFLLYIIFYCNDIIINIIVIII